ncbi:hypothetical protein TELCIR_02020 [Teladorsagia circumcincta]|uniref:Dual-specificity kinase n=1 Tax=Teladorsagia circumcincta TaxID=45464 RepID=A0A2G9V1R1_TELCI|nr:hypothetical protein TELCIR_02020 [Teladorsagia circumcincta]
MIKEHLTSLHHQAERNDQGRQEGPTLTFPGHAASGAAPGMTPEQEHQPTNPSHKVATDGTEATTEKIHRGHADAPIRKLTCDLIKTYKNINESFYLRKALRRQEHQGNIQSSHNASTTTAPVNLQSAGSGGNAQVQGTTQNSATSLDRQQNSGPKGGGPHNGGYDDKNNDYILKDGECFNARPYTHSGVRYNLDNRRSADICV